MVFARPSGSAAKNACAGRSLLHKLVARLRPVPNPPEVVELIHLRHINTLFGCEILRVLVHGLLGDMRLHVVLLAFDRCRCNIKLRPKRLHLLKRTACAAATVVNGFGGVATRHNSAQPTVLLSKLAIKFVKFRTKTYKNQILLFHIPAGISCISLFSEFVQ